MHRAITALLVAILLVPTGVAPAASQTAPDGQIQSVSYAGSGNVTVAGADLALWQSSPHQFTVTITSANGVNGQLCLNTGATGGSNDQQITCAPVSVSTGSTKTATIAVDQWPAKALGNQQATVVLQSSDGATVYNTYSFPVDVITKGGDLDGDGLTNGKEASIGTSLTKADTDGDGLTDKMEVDTYGTDPTKADTDGDGLKDGAEVNQYGTDPTKADSDGDGLTDAKEITLGTNPNKADTDGDGLNDGPEVNVYSTDPLKGDTDGDGLGDGAEVKKYDTNPLKADTDGDGLTDGQEVNTYDTNPTKVDTDGDGLTDGAEVNQYGTDPTKADTDGDGLTDGKEVNTYNTNPTNPDTDGDGLTDGEEVNQYGTNPNKVDTNGDGRSDYAEVKGNRIGPFTPATAGIIGLFGLVLIATFVLTMTGRIRIPQLDRLVASLAGLRARIGGGEGDEGRDDGGEEAVNEVPVEFLSNEQRVLRLLDEHDGRMKQADIVKETDWSKAKVSRVLSAMEEDGEVVKIDVGRGNIVTRPDDFPSGAESPFDG